MITVVMMMMMIIIDGSGRGIVGVVVGSGYDDGYNDINDNG